MSVSVYVHNEGQVGRGGNHMGLERFVEQRWRVEVRHDGDGSRMEGAGPFASKTAAQVAARELVARHDRPTSRARLVEAAPGAPVLERVDPAGAGVGLLATGSRLAGGTLSAESARALLDAATVTGQASSQALEAAAASSPRNRTVGDELLAAFERARPGRRR